MKKNNKLDPVTTSLAYNIQLLYAIPIHKLNKTSIYV